MELASHQKLRWKKTALENENNILQQRLFEAGQLSQTNEIRMRSLNTEREEVAKLKETIHNYQRALANQREELDSEKRNHALTAQSLNHESNCHKATENSLDQERSYFRGFIEFLDTLDIPTGANRDNRPSIGALWLERNNMATTIEQLGTKVKRTEEELRGAREELEHKRFLLAELSRNFEVQAESASMSPASEGSEGA